MNSLERFQALQTSTKRDVASMTTALADRAEDATVRAAFREDRYGLFEYCGAVATVNDGSRLLAARPFDTGQGKPTSSLRAFETSDGDPELEGEPVEATALQHGDLASALLEHHLYGEFVVTGVALQNPEGTRTLLGEWIVADAGAAAPTVREVRRIAGATDHDIGVPPRLALLELEVAG